MASFFFVHSTNNQPLDLPETTKERAIRALLERSPGEVRQLSSSTFLAASSGSEGDLRETGDRLWIRDGVPLDGGEPASYPNLPTDGKAERWNSVTGCYALCSFHIPSSSLLVARDHFGKRPVFYGEAEGRIIIASECKILQALGVPFEIDPAPLQEALLYRWVIGERHLFKGSRQVPPGGLVKWDPERSFTSHRYWTARFEPENPQPESLTEFCDATETALRRTIRTANRTYGRVGLLLSGGVDSSLLAALAKDEVDSLDAFVGRIPGCEHREDERAVKVAEMLGIRCHVVDIDTSRFETDFSHMVRRIEELPRHPNNLVVNQLYEAAGGTVDVMLEGDGTGTFWGHSNSRRTFQFMEKSGKVKSIPLGLRRLVARLLEQLPGDRAWQLARILAWDPNMFARTQEALYYSRPVLKTLGLSLLNEPGWRSGEWDESVPIDDESQAYMVRSLLRGGNVRHDRLSQPHGIVALSPFLSTDCWKVSRRMPREIRIHEGTTKPVLRTLLDRYLPKKVGQWSKIGFEVPWSDWIKNELGPLRKEAHDFLRSTPFLPDGYWDVSNRVEDPEGVWTALSFYVLLREFGLLESHR